VVVARKKGNNLPSKGFILLSLIVIYETVVHIQRLIGTNKIPCTFFKYFAMHIYDNFEFFRLTRITYYFFGVITNYVSRNVRRLGRYYCLCLQDSYNDGNTLWETSEASSSDHRIDLPC
jgi:hypothetical protein